MGIKTLVRFPESSLKSVIYNLIKDEKILEARQVFDKIPAPKIHLYTIMIMGYTQNNQMNKALHLFHQMPVRDVVSWNSLIKGCLDCGNLDLSYKLFVKMPERNEISWTTMLDGFAQFGKVDIAEKLFYMMPSKDTAAWNSMVFGYCTNNRIEDAKKLFKIIPNPNVITWTTMISGLEQYGLSNEALSFFKGMQSFQIVPTSNTLACVLSACSNLCALKEGGQVHSYILKSGTISNCFVCTSLITFYANCKQMENCRRVFNDQSHRDVAVWTALLTGFNSNENYEHALAVFHKMIKIGIKANQSTFTSALHSCSELEALDKGQVIHANTVKLGLNLDVFIGNSLIVMYTKCGSMNDGVSVFNEMSYKNLISWNAIIVACAQHGHGQKALDLFDVMNNSLVKPDEITFVGLLSACSHSRMLDTGRHIFRIMNVTPSIEVKLEHYVCMVDLLSRCGQFEEAEEFIRTMPIKPNAVVWLALLSACRGHSNFDLAIRAANHVFDLDQCNSAAYVLLSNMYALAGRWNDVSRLRSQMREKGIVKNPGFSWVILKGSKHSFLCNDRTHPMIRDIHRKLAILDRKLKEFGYVPDKSLALHDVEDEQKEEMLSYHSERLAIAFALLNTVEGSTIRVMKNLRICGNCHSVIKIISNIVGREIVVRDLCRFHHFKEGVCSCGDYW